MRTQFIVHPDEISIERIDSLKSAGITCLGIHPVGGKNAYKTLEDLVSLLKTDEFRALLDYAENNGIEIEYELHAMGYLMPKNLFSSNPEYFREDKDGSRNADYNFCISNKKAMDLVCENAVTLAQNLYNSSNNYYFWTDDGRDVFCHCDKCKNISPSNQALTITNAIARALKKHNKNAKCAYLAYMATITPPTIKKEDNVFLEYAPFEKYTAKGENAPFLIEQEQKMLTPLLDYFSKEDAKVLEYWYDNSLYSSWKKPPKKFTLDENQMQKDVNFYKQKGFSYISTFGCYLGKDYEELYGKTDLTPFATTTKD
ncbi:MAG: DUF4838 domain-containing protein [Clostridiales bacterium]|nr:DUF4838 domain-containing protein [Clostridiales bacterium]